MDHGVIRTARLHLLAPDAAVLAADAKDGAAGLAAALNVEVAPDWPPETVKGLHRIGEVDRAFDWLKGLSKSANQGPWGQAHFADSVVERECGGARKAPPDFPYITDWTCSSNGSWVGVVIGSIFGIDATPGDGLTSRPQFGPFDPDARLRNIAYQGRRYHASRHGLESA